MRAALARRGLLLASLLVGGEVQAVAPPPTSGFSLGLDRQAPARAFHLLPATPAQAPPAGAVQLPQGPVQRQANVFRIFSQDSLALLEAPRYWRRSQWARFGLGLMAVAVVHQFDGQIRHALRGSIADGGDGNASKIRPLGQEGSLAVVGLAYLAGKAFHRPEWQEAARDAAEASFLTSGLVVPALKGTFGRSRPNSGASSSRFRLFSGGTSFPSGEAAQAFTVAAVFAAHSESRWAKALWWAAAGVVSYQRLELDAHWASDVLAGALIGASIGRWTVRRHRPGREDLDVSITPAWSRHGQGVAVSLRW